MQNLATVAVQVGVLFALMAVGVVCRRVTSYTTVWLVSGGAKEMGMKGYMRESGISTSRSDRAMCVFSQ